MFLPVHSFSTLQTKQLLNCPCELNLGLPKTCIPNHLLFLAYNLRILDFQQFRVYFQTVSLPALEFLLQEKLFIYRVFLATKRHSDDYCYFPIKEHL